MAKTKTEKKAKTPEQIRISELRAEIKTIRQEAIAERETRREWIDFKTAIRLKIGELSQSVISKKVTPKEAIEILESFIGE